jgi:branched-subunit amino acid aminotransferase/4-amino-4-deoxychorismate lyase
LEIAAESGLNIEERPVAESELKTADEAFITSSFKDIVPIVRIDDFNVNNSEVGPITKNLISQFVNLIKLC